VTEPPPVDGADVCADTPADTVRRAAIKLAALGQDGLTYTEGHYDRDRYHQITAIAAKLLAVVSGQPATDLVQVLGRDAGYATPKVDVRGVLFDDAERVLLMRERIDGRWSLPGGWADPGDSPTAAVTREVLEEAGYPSEVTKLVACWDRDVQGNVPPLPVHVYKLFFLCRVTGPARPPDALETLAIGWFELDELPPLSLGRVNERQLRRALEHHRDPTLPTELD
jgi:ADP-ribose pyrophosphatase YjhB (NUDIX family)